MIAIDSTYSFRTNVATIVVLFLQKKYSNKLRQNYVILKSSNLRCAASYLLAITEQSHITEIEILNAGRLANQAGFIIITGDDGLLRLETRIQDGHRQPITPILINKKSKLFGGFIINLHKNLQHAPLTVLWSQTQWQMWAPGLMSACRRIINKCLRCRRYTRTPLQPKMAGLPVNRILISRPFDHILVDHCEPFTTTIIRRRGNTDYTRT
jgi:hypothetical protein